MSLRRRVLDRFGLQTEPQHVEEASRYEKIRREIWMFASLIISCGLAILPAVALSPWLGQSGADIPFTPVFVGTVCLWFYLDIYHVFPWGIDRFGLVVPWQFREVEE